MPEIIGNLGAQMIQLILAGSLFLSGGCGIILILASKHRSANQMNLRIDTLKSEKKQLSFLDDALVGSPVPKRNLRRGLNNPYVPIATALLLGGLWILIGQFSVTAILIGGTITFLGFLVFLVRRYLENKRLKTLSNQFPEALDLLTRGARVGLSLEDSFRQIQRTLSMPIAAVFEEVSNNLSIGISLEESLEKVSERIKLREFRYLAAVLTVQLTSGGKYAETIELLSQNIRDRHEQEKRVKAATSEARTAAKVVALIAGLAVLSMFFLNPTQFQFLLADPSGQMMLGYCVASVLLGFIAIYLMLGSLNG
ncbi:hypothetical protein A9Q83_01870 [Alphaproteobacteria bacterium 46_93_T64]|nr:hypothetical protein A9Q83_01870 [Alphaproteobacteria bacterium 46_93_T64]